MRWEDTLGTSSVLFRVIGQRTPKVDAVDKVTGRAEFGADVRIPGSLAGKVLRSPFAHARIKRIDTGKAEALPGVVAVITGEDLPLGTEEPRAAVGNVSDPDYFLRDEVMARDKVLFHGQAVAAVAATSLAVAEVAVGLIDVEYEALPHVLDPLEAMKPDSVVLHDGLRTRSGSGVAEHPSNLAEHLEMGRGDVDTSFGEADVLVERSFRTQVVHHGYIEPDSEAAHFRADGSLTVWANTQGIFTHRRDLARVLGIPMGKIRVIPTEVGGAFGGKEAPRVSPLCAALSRKAGLPVRITFGREEVFRGTGPGQATVSTVKVGARRDGTITGIRARCVYDAGAYPGAFLQSAIRRVFSHYRTDNLRIDAYDVVTNKPHVAAYRAPGATPTAFALESVIDEVADALGMDPLEFRLKNVTRAGDLMPDGVELPSISLVELLERARRHPCWTAPLAAPGQGRGIAVGLWTMPGGTASCHITLGGDGSVTLTLGAVDLSATRTSLAMVAAESLGLGLSDVRVVVGDTDMVAYSDSSSGDKITYIASKAVRQAGLDMLDRLKERAAGRFHVSPAEIAYEWKRFWVRDAPEMEMTLADLARRSVEGEGAVMGYASVSEETGAAAIAPTGAVHVVDVEVDRETGKTQIIRYTAFQDVGLSVNPDQVEGQMQGGVTQGIGWALSEEYDFDERGAMSNASLLDYRLSTCVDVPLIDAVIAEVPSSDHPYGIRAVGQLPIVPTAAAIGNAIHRATGVRLYELPMTPERVHRALASADAEG